MLIAVITLLSVWAIERGEAQRDRAELNARATAIASALERRANASSAYLRAGAALLSTMDDVPAADFRRFVSELRLDEETQGADGIGWARVVRPGEERGSAAPEILSGREAGAVNPNSNSNSAAGGTAPYSVPVTYLFPDTERSRRALGFDMFSEPTRRAAMIEAERSHHPVATNKVILMQEGGNDAPGFLIYMPVFESGQLGRQLKGYIYSPFNAQNFLASALELENAGEFGVRLYDMRGNEEGLLATTYDGDPAGRAGVTKPVTIGSNLWGLTVSEVRQKSLSGLSMATLIFGLLVASLLMLVVRMLTQQAHEDEISLRWFAEQASIRNTLTRELNHRVKNTLANVLSIIALTRRRSERLDDFATALDGRIRALSATHDLLTQSDWGSTPVRSVIETELLPYTMGGEQQVSAGGPDVELAPNDALSLGLAVHELATNAAKYGALSQPEGTLSVNWTMTDAGLVRVEWFERGGPPVPQERTRGFGTDLIERIVAHELRHPVELDFDPAGVRCVLLIPVRKRKDFMIRADRSDKQAALSH